MDRSSERNPDSFFDRYPKWLRQLKKASVFELSSESEPPDFKVLQGLTYVLDGAVLASALDAHGEVIFSVVHGSGALIGLEQMNGLVVPYQLRTLPFALLALIEVKEMRHLIQNALGEPTQGLIEAMLQTATATMRERLSLREHVQARVAQFLLDPPKVGRPQHFQRTVMAKILSMRPETLSRTLKSLEGLGAIRLKPRLEVTDRDALEAYLKNP